MDYYYPFFNEKRRFTMFSTSTPNKVIQQNNIKEINEDMSCAIYNYDDQLLEETIAQGADVNARDIRDSNEELMDPPIIMALDVHNRPAIRTLLKHGAKVNTTRQTGADAFGIAVATAGDF